MRVRHYTRGGMTPEDGVDIAPGTDWPAAKPFAELAPDLGTAMPGDGFLIGVDRNRENPIFWSDRQLRIMTSGQPDAPIALRAGYVSKVGYVQTIRPGSRNSIFRRSRADRRRSEPSLDGDPFLTLENGASNIEITGLIFLGAPGSGFIRIGDDASQDGFSNLLFRDIHGTFAGRVIESASDAAVVGLRVEDCSATAVARGFARLENLSDAVFRNLTLDADSVDAGGRQICQLFAVVRGENLLFENIWMRDAVNGLGVADRGSDYVQGDGIVCEEETSFVTIRNCHATDMGDGGYDLKAANVLFEDSSSRRCKKGIRIWSHSDNVIRNSLLVEPRETGSRGSCVWCAGRVTIHDTRLQADGGNTIFAFGEGSELPSVRMVGGSIELAEGTPLIAEGPGLVELENVLVNGTLITQSIQSNGGSILL